MNKLIWIVLLVCASSQAQTEMGHCLRTTHRIFNGLSVDLTPLATWWGNEPDRKKDTKLGIAPAPRPLVAWDRVKGTLVEKRALGWVVQAEIETTPGKKESRTILLKHPPEQEKIKFEALKKRENEIKNYRSGMQTASELNRDVASASHERADTLREVGNASTSVRTYNDMNAAANARSRQGSAATARSEQQIANANAATENLKSVTEGLWMFPPSDTYIVDFFALKTGETVGGMPVYDLGQLPP